MSLGAIPIPGRHGGGGMGGGLQSDGDNSEEDRLISYGPFRGLSSSPAPSSSSLLYGSSPMVNTAGPMSGGGGSGGGGFVAKMPLPAATYAQRSATEVAQRKAPVVRESTSPST